LVHDGERNRILHSSVFSTGDEPKGDGELSDDKVKRARTEALFRDVNERIAESAQRFDADSTQFVCECSDPNCTHRIAMTLDEYEDVRADGATFVLEPGHEQEDIERVVERRGRFHVVEKVQETVRATVRHLNPRPDTA
jgi:hypothetical protein